MPEVISRRKEVKPTYLGTCWMCSTTYRFQHSEMTFQVPETYGHLTKYVPMFECLDCEISVQGTMEEVT